MGFDQVTDYLATRGVPQIAKSLFPDILTIVKETVTQNAGGDFVKSGETVSYGDIPCRARPMERHEYRDQYADKLLSVEGYIVTLPKYKVVDGTPSRINIDPTIHRLKVNARGEEPEKVFRIIAIRAYEANFEVVCGKEN